ncbi:MAG TPA: ankyrin repeat domain-containing protein [Pyrinomonadaceae bacterium]|nr:ankyrin repeat domain-containing protein [Pyrinomonadaceae bacterium]
MFPNPQDALPLPPRPTTERHKKLAKDLVKACKSDDPNAIRDWAEKWVTPIVKASDIKPAGRRRKSIKWWTNQIAAFAKRQLTNGRCRLADAQLIVARSYGFRNWSTFVKHIEALKRKTSAIFRFEAAADAIVNGHLSTLKRLLKQDPKLVHARSTLEHNATLLHYTSANGVESYRQNTPPNIVEIVKVLLEAGSEVDAEADVYGGGWTTLGLVATSAHPFLAGVQNPLMQILLDHGAEIDHTTSAGKRQYAVRDCLANGRREAALYLAERGARLNLEGAAGIGRLDVVKKYFTEDGKRRSKTTKKEVLMAFLTACSWGNNDVVEFLLDKVDLSGHGGDGQTGLHCAAICGQLETIKLLLKFKPPLEVVNVYGGTVLGQTLWSAAHGGDTKLYSAIIETLIAAGAKVPARHVPVNDAIDELLRRHGSVPEPTWYWFGEGP